ncbi:MAG: flagellin [Clostridiales bacterium]|nr:flagellin [Clostridiales bacterium]
MVVQHNLSAMNANRNLGVTTGSLSKSTEKLSSGYRINRAGDDAAGLAISEKMRGQIRGLNQASTNAEDGNSLIQTAEGALQETQNILQRMRELAVQATNDTNTDSDREQIQNEISQLTNEVDRIATSSEFNTKKLLDGTQAGALSYKAGAAGIDGTFKNGNVKLISLKASESCLVGKDDVIRITIQKDISAGSLGAGNGIGKLSASTTKATISTLNGISASVSLNVDSGELKITGSAYASKTANYSDATTGDITFKISGASSLKAGDVITITLSKMTGTRKAKPDQEGLRFQVGANAGQEVMLNINSMKAKDLGIVKTSTSSDVILSQAKSGEALSVTSHESASLAIQAYDKALTKVSTERAKLGAVQNRLEHTIANLDTSEENLQAAESRIRDTDMAEEMTAYSKSNILMQAGQSMLAQANQSSQGVLSLLQ